MSMSEQFRKLEEIGSRLGGGNHAAELAEAITTAKKTGDLSLIRTFVSNLEAGLGLDGEGAGGALQAFTDIVIKEVDKFASSSSGHDSGLAECVKMVVRLFKAQQEFLEVAAAHCRPTDQELVGLLGPSASIISQIQEYREKNRASANFNLLSMISESVPALGWVSVAPAPVPFIRDMKEAGEFFSNRALRDGKQNKVIVDAWFQVLTRLGEYVKQYYTTGLTWNNDGEMYCPANNSNNGPGERKSWLHSHQTSQEETKPKKATKRVVYGGSQKTAAKEKLELEGKKWIVEHFSDNNNIQITDTNPSQSVSIYKCNNSVIKVSGKCNTIILNNCAKVGVVFDSLISSAEVINSTSVELQVLGSVPTVTMDKSDSIQLYLSPQSADCEIVTAKTSGVNVVMSEEGGESKEYPIPEQFKTLINGLKISTSPVEAF